MGFVIKIYINGNKKKKNQKILKDQTYHAGEAEPAKEWYWAAVAAEGIAGLDEGT